MKLLVTIDIAHDALGVPALLLALPGALQSVAIATSAGVAETGPRGMDVQVPMTSALATVHFRVDSFETGRRLPAPEPLGDVPDAATVAP